MQHQLTPALRIRQALDQRLTDHPSLTTTDGIPFPTGARYPVTPDFIVQAPVTGFYGLVKTYELSKSDDYQLVMNDLRRLADASERSKWGAHIEASSMALMAVLVTEDPAGHAELAKALRRVQDQERLLESVGLSQLFWNSEVQKVLAKWGETTSTVRNRQLDRFFAPLLLTARTTVAKNDSLTVWQARLRTTVRAAVEGEDQVGKAMATPVEQQVRERLASQLAAVTAPEASTDPEALTFRSIENLKRFRRFNAPSCGSIPFGARMTIISGTNGTGKSSILSSVAMGLTGSIRSDIDGESVPETALWHAGASNGAANFGTLVVNTTSIPTTEKHLEIRNRSVLNRPPLETFLMSQTALRRFILQDDKDRFAWFADQLGLDTSATDITIKKLMDELKAAIQSSPAQLVLGTWNGKNKQLRTRAKERITHALNNAPSLEVVKDGLATVQEKLTTLSAILGDRVPVERFWTKLEHIEQAVTAIEKAAADVLSSLTGDQSMVTHVDILHAAFDSLSVARADLMELVPSRLLEAAERLAKYKFEKQPETPSPDDIESVRGRLAGARSELAMLSSLGPTLNDANDLPDRAQSVVDRLRTQVEAYEHKFGSVTTNGDVQLGDLLTEYETLVKPVLERGPLFGTVLVAVEARTVQLSAEINNLERRVASVTLMKIEGARLQKYEEELRQALEPLFSAVVPGVAVPIQGALAALGTDATVQAVLALGLQVQAFGSSALPSLSDDLSELLVHYYDEPSTGQWGGTYGQLYAWDYLQELSTKINREIEDTVRQILSGEFGAALQEILAALTGYGWSHADVQMRVEKKGVAFDTDWGAASNILNVAEQNLLGLAFFFTAYLYVGRRWSNAVFIDDPFQNLDDVNMYGFIRMFDDVANAVGAEQVILALHQPGLTDYFVTEFANKAGQVDEKMGAGFVLLQVYQSSDTESDIDVKRWAYR